MIASFDEVLRRIKHATNTKTQVELAEVLGIRQSSISDAKRRNSVPSEWYMKLFERFGLNPDWLKKGNGPMYLRTDRGYEPFDGPLPFKVAEEIAGYGETEGAGVVVTVHSTQCEGSDESGWMPLASGKLTIPQPFARPGLIVVKMEASSMEPLIRRHSYVGIDGHQKNIVSGEVYGIYLPFEGLSIKRVFLDAVNSRLVLRSEARDHPEQYLPAETHASKIIGRVVWVLQHV